MSNVTFLADDVRQTHGELEQRGVEFTSPPESTPWGAYTIFKDPDGNRFVLSSR
jgi:predicted enzyme related to lactoylglutathione lyase